MVTRNDIARIATGMQSRADTIERGLQSDEVLDIAVNRMIDEAEEAERFDEFTGPWEDVRSHVGNLLRTSHRDGFEACLRLAEEGHPVSSMRRVFNHLP
jgi:hypothetical protein